MRPSTRNWARIPSHLISIAHRSPAGAGAEVASIGWMNLGSSSRCDGRIQAA